MNKDSKIFIDTMMSPSQPAENELLKQILEPLLEDFQHWFSRAQALLESESISFLTAQEKDDLLERVKASVQEVATAQMLFKVTGVGIEASMLVPWHKLVRECWQVSMRQRSLKEPQG